MVAKPKPNPKQQLQRNVKKWTKPLMDAGWTCIPNVIIQRQHALGLDSVDLNIIAYLASLWWTDDNPPYPSVKAMATILQIKPRSVQRRIAALEANGFIRREARFDAVKGRTTNVYRLDKLIELATPYAQEELERRAKRKAENAETARLKKPRLHAVK
ncbi:MAG: helix-turn-helix domain-containing protein [Phycisphaerales bacterium]